jgi:hypothetical protein
MDINTGKKLNSGTEIPVFGRRAPGLQPEEA